MDAQEIRRWQKLNTLIYFVILKIFSNFAKWLLLSFHNQRWRSSRLISYATLSNEKSLFALSAILTQKR